MPAKSKPTAKQKRCILLCYEAGIFGCRRLARDYGVSHTAVHKVAKRAGLTWPKKRGWRWWQKVGTAKAAIMQEKRRQAMRRQNAERKARKQGSAVEP
jgi:hypothetical protein